MARLLLTQRAMGLVRMLALACALCSPPWLAAAQQVVTLAEVVPALRGTPEGEIAVAPAPSPGTRRVVRRREISRALKQHGVELAGVSIPRQVQVWRDARDIQGAELEPLVARAVADVIGGCTLQSVRLPQRLRIGSGEVTVTAEPPASVRDGTVSIAASVTAGGHTQRLLVASLLECPPPVIRPGANVRIVVRVGAVLASAPGQARQAGRVGDVIVVVNSLTGSRLSGRVLDPDTVEVQR